MSIMRFNCISFNDKLIIIGVFVFWCIGEGKVLCFIVNNVCYVGDIFYV